MPRSQAKTGQFDRVVRAIGLLLAAGVLTASAIAQAPASTKVVGKVKSVSGDTVVLTSDAGMDTTLSFSPTAHIRRATPGQTDLKSAPQIQLSDVQVGDRMVAAGQPGEGNVLTVSTALVMKQADISAKQQHDNDAWRRGVGGIVKEVNAAAGTITINNALVASGKPIVIHVSPQTDVKRYAPGSVKFDEAKTGTLDQIKAGDQLRARGTKNGDGTEFTADAIVSGSFRDVAGTVVSTDAANNSVTVTDLATKKPVTNKITADSQMRKLPQMMAMGIAMRLKGGGAPGAMVPGAGAVADPAAGGGPGAGAPGARRGEQGGASQGQGGTPGQGGNGPAGGQFGGARNGGMGGGNWRGNGGPPDFQQMLSRLPAVSLTELNKGDAVMLVATEGASGSQPTAITLLTGVEPVLSAAPAGTNAAATVLSPWNLGQGAPAGGEGGGPQ